MMWCIYLIIDWIHLGIFKYRYASEGPLKGILGYTDEDVVSNDFVGDSRYLSLVLWLFCGLLLLYVGENYWQMAISSSLRPPLFIENCLNPSVEIKFCIILCWIGFLVPLHHLLFLDISTFVPSNCTALHKFPGSAPLSISSLLAFTDYSWKDIEICNLHLVSMDFISFQVKYIRCKGRDWAQ